MILSNNRRIKLEDLITFGEFSMGDNYSIMIFME